MPFVSGQLSKLPTISSNTDSILRYRNHYATGTAQVILPTAGNGTRNIVTAIMTTGNTITIGLGTGGTISTTIFTHTQAAGPMDLSMFFGNAPMAHFEAGKDVIINGEANKVVTVAYIPYKG